MFILTFLVVALAVISAKGTVIYESGPYCGMDAIHANGGTTINISCSVDSNSFQWVLPGPDIINHISGNLPIATSGRFTSTVVEHNISLPLTNATLTFTASPSLDNAVISCLDGNAISASCTLKVKTIPGVPLNVVASNSNLTFESVYLEWTAPTDDGGDTVNYIITISPVPLADTDSNDTDITDTGCMCTGGTCTANMTSCNVTELMYGVNYTFTVVANNSVGMSNLSTGITVLVPNAIRPPSVDNLTVCMSYNANRDTVLNVIWSPCPVIIDPALTPSIDDYTISVSGMSGIDQLNTSECNNSPRNIAEGQMYTVGVTVNNMIGSSLPNSSVFDATWLKSEGATQVSNNTFNIIYSTAQCVVDMNGLIVNVDFSNDTLISPSSTSVPYINGTTGTFDFTVLVPAATITYTLQVTDSDGTVGSSIVGMYTDGVVLSTTDMPSLSSSGTASLTLSSSSVPSVSVTVSGSTGLPTGAIIGIAVGGALILLGIIILLIVLCLCIRSKKGEKANFSRSSRVGSAEPIALVNRTEAVPETGQALYQDPDTIKREEAPTGDLYALPDKPRRNAPTTPSAHAPEMATYQDPNTIQREQAPTGDLYALPEKKPVYSQVNKEKTGIVYAELGLDNTNSTGPGRTNEVLYSDVHVGHQPQ